MVHPKNTYKDSCKYVLQTSDQILQEVHISEQNTYNIYLI